MNSKLGVTVLGLVTLTGFAVLPSACGGDTGSVTPKTDGGSSSGSSSGGSSSGSGSTSGSTSGSSSGGSTSGSGSSSGGSTSSSGGSTSSSGGSTSSSGSSSGSVPTDHRTSDAACGVVPPAGMCPFGPEQASTCKSDSDCTAGLNGRCGPKGALPVCACAYDACTKDADCAAGSACACDTGASGNACVASGCRVDSDCGAGGYCSPTIAVDPTCAHVGFAGYYCHTKSDECVNDSDCPAAPGPMGPQQCVYSSAKQHWACTVVPICAM